MLSLHNKAKSKGVGGNSGHNSDQQALPQIGSMASFSELFQNPHLFHQASSPNQIHVYEGVHPEKLFGGKNSPQMKWMARELNEWMFSYHQQQPQPNAMFSPNELALKQVEFGVRSFVFTQVISTDSSLSAQKESWKKDVEKYTGESSHFVHNIPLQGSYVRSSDGGLTQTLYIATLPFIDRTNAPLLNNRVNLLRDWYLGKNQKQSTFTVKSLEEIIENDDFLSDLGSQTNLNFISNLFYEISYCIKELHDQCSITHNSILPKNIICFQQGESFHFLIHPPSFGLASMIDNLNDDHVTYFSPQVFSRFENGEAVFTFDNDLHMLGTLILRILLGEEFDAKQLDADDWDNESNNLINSISSRVANCDEKEIIIFKNLATLAVQCVNPDNTKRPTIIQFCRVINENLGYFYQIPPQPVYDEILVQFGHDKDSDLSLSASFDDEEEASFVESRVMEEEQKRSVLKKKTKQNEELLPLARSSSLSKGLGRKDSRGGSTGGMRKEKSQFDAKPKASPSRNLASSISSSRAPPAMKQDLSGFEDFSSKESAPSVQQELIEGMADDAFVPASDKMHDSIIQLSPQISQQQQVIPSPPPQSHLFATSQVISSYPPPPPLSVASSSSSSVVPTGTTFPAQATSDTSLNFSTNTRSRRLARDDSYGATENEKKELHDSTKERIDEIVMKQKEILEKSSWRLEEQLDERCDDIHYEAKSFSKKSKSFHFDFSSALSSFFRNIGEFFRSFSYRRKDSGTTQPLSADKIPLPQPEKPITISVDTTKKDQYSIVKRLNDGASAIILQVKQKDTDQLYVMKRFREGVDTDYHREVECLKAFSHNNIVQYVDDFSYSEIVDDKQVVTYVVIMEFCTFGDLFKQTMSFAQGGKQRLMRPMVSQHFFEIFKVRILTICCCNDTENVKVHTSTIFCS